MEPTVSTGRIGGTLDPSVTELGPAAAWWQMDAFRVRSRLLTAVVEASTLLACAPDFDAAVQETLRRMGETAHLSRVVLFREEPAENGGAEHVVRAEWCAPGVRSHRECGTEVIPSEAAEDLLVLLRRGESFWRSLDEVGQPLHGVFVRMGIQATGCAPLMIEGCYAGTVTFDDCVMARTWDEAQVEALTAAANAIAAAMQNRRAAEIRTAELTKANAALRDSVARLASVNDPGESLDAVLAAVVEQTGAVGAALFQVVAPDALQMRAAVLDRAPADIAHDSRLAMWRRPYGVQEFEGGWEQIVHGPQGYLVSEVQPAESGMASGVGAWHRAMGHRSVLHLPLLRGAEPIGFVGLCFDQPFRLAASTVELARTLAQQATLALEMVRLADTAREAAVMREREAAAEGRARELKRANAALQEVTDALAVARGMGEIVPAVLRIVQRAFECPGLGYYEHRDTNTVRLRYWLHDGQVLDPAALLALAPDGEQAVIRAVAEGFTVPDAYLGSSVGERTLAVSIDHRAGTLRPNFDAWCVVRGWPVELNVPLVVNGRAVGALVLCREAERTYTSSETALAEALAKQLALAVEAARLADAERAAVVAREQEKAAQVRLVELARVNEALRGGVARLVEAPDIESILDVWLLDAMRLTGAAGGAVLRRVGTTGTEFVFATVAQGDVLTRETIASEFVDTVGEVSRRDPAGFFARMVRGEFVVVAVEELARWYPLGAEYHRQLGNDNVWHMPFRVSGAVAGYLGLAFTDQREPDAVTLRTLEALALQAGMTMELRQKSEAARQLAVARERERAAQDQIAALTETSRLLQRSTERLNLEATPEEFTKPFLEEMHALLGADSAAQFVVDDAAGTLTGWAFYDRGQWVARPAVRRALVADIPAWAEIVAHPERPTVFDLINPRDAARVYPESVVFLRERGCTWLVNLPLVVGGRVAWILGANGVRRDRLTEKNLTVFTTLARQLTLALELHRLGEEARALAVAREREEAARERAAELTRTNEAVGDSLNKLVELTDLHAFLREVFGQCARLAGALGGSLFFHDEGSVTLRKELGWIKGQVVDFVEQPDSPYWHEPVPVATIPDWAESVQIDPQDERVWVNARAWHRACSYGWMYRVPIKAGSHAFGFMGMAFARREDLTAQRVELICAISHQIALAVQLDRLAGEAKEVALLGERNRIARDLHDVLAQGFVGVLAQVGVLEGALETADLPEINRVTERVRAIAREGLEEARRSVHALRPLGQADRLFERLHAILVGLTAGTGLQPEATQTGTPAALSDQADWAAVKFVQQALTNTLRYAAADTFRLVLAWEEAGLTLTAQDDGAGFDPAVPRAGIGLRGMTERAAECGGSLDVDSRPGGGTILRLFLPASPGSASIIP